MFVKPYFDGSIEWFLFSYSKTIIKGNLLELVKEVQFMYHSNIEKLKTLEVQ